MCIDLLSKNFTKLSSQKVSKFIDFECTYCLQTKTAIILCNKSIFSCLKEICLTFHYKECFYSLELLLWCFKTLLVFIVSGLKITINEQTRCIMFLNPIFCSFSAPFLTSLYNRFCKKLSISLFPLVLCIDFLETISIRLLSYHVTEIAPVNITSNLYLAK